MILRFYKCVFGDVEEYRLNIPDGKSIVNAEIKIPITILKWKYMVQLNAMFL